MDIHDNSWVINMQIGDPALYELKEKIDLILDEDLSYVRATPEAMPQGTSETHGHTTIDTFSQDPYIYDHPSTVTDAFSQDSYTDVRDFDNTLEEHRRITATDTFSQNFDDDSEVHRTVTDPVTRSSIVKRGGARKNTSVILGNCTLLVLTGFMSVLRR
jgi:hypothetical protein